jgi:hypothetical protein
MSSYSHSTGPITKVVVANGLTGLVEASSAVSSITVTRPANATAYAALDVVGGVINFTSIGPAGAGIKLTGASLAYNVASIPAGMTTFRLHLYNATPPSALADNAPFDLPAGDRASYLGYLDLPTILDLGATLFTQLDNFIKQVNLASGQTSLYGYLVTTGGYTPAGSSETLQVTLRSTPV